VGSEISEMNFWGQHFHEFHTSRCPLPKQEFCPRRAKGAALQHKTAKLLNVVFCNKITFLGGYFLLFLRILKIPGEQIFSAQYLYTLLVSGFWNCMQKSIGF